MKIYVLTAEEEFRAGRKWPHPTKYMVVAEEDPIYFYALTDEKEEIPRLRKKVEEKVVQLSNKRAPTEQTCGS